MIRLGIACLVLLFSAVSFGLADSTTQPAAGVGASTQPITPSEALHAMLVAVDQGNRSGAISYVDAKTPFEQEVAALHVDAMIADAKLKAAVRAKIGPIDPMVIQLQIAGASDCASMSQEVAGDAATVTAYSIDDPQHVQATFQMVRVAGAWKLSLESDCSSVQGSPAARESEFAIGKMMVRGMGAITDNVNSGKITTEQQVGDRLEQVLESTGAH